MKLILYEVKKIIENVQLRPTVQGKLSSKVIIIIIIIISIYFYFF